MSQSPSSAEGRGRFRSSQEFAIFLGGSGADSTHNAGSEFAVERMPPIRTFEPVATALGTCVGPASISADALSVGVVDETERPSFLGSAIRTGREVTISETEEEDRHDMFLFPTTGRIGVTEQSITENTIPANWRVCK